MLHVKVPGTKIYSKKHYEYFQNKYYMSEWNTKLTFMQTFMTLLTICENYLGKYVHSNKYMFWKGLYGFISEHLMLTRKVPCQFYNKHTSKLPILVPWVWKETKTSIFISNCMNFIKT